MSSLTQEAFAQSAAEKEDIMADKESGSDGDLIQFSEDDGEVMEDKGEGEGGSLKAALDVQTPVWVEASDDNIDTTIIHMELVEDLAKKKKDLGKREQDLLTREALLKAAEQELDRKFQELTQLRTEIEALLVTQSEEEQARILSLVKVYEGMKAKDCLLYTSPSPRDRG